MSWKPRRMEAFARWYGLHVHYEELPAGVRGLFAEFSRDIAINRNDHPLEQQFTIAHELTHFTSHYRRMRHFTPRQRENDADFFSYGLLFIARRFDVLRDHFARHPTHVFLALIAVPFFLPLFRLARVISRIRIRRRRSRTLNPA